MNVGAILPGNDRVRLSDGTRQLDEMHASRGGRPYPKEIRKQVIELWQLSGFDALDTPHFNALQANHKFPHIETCTGRARDGYVYFKT